MHKKLSSSLLVGAILLTTVGMPAAVLASAEEKRAERIQEISAALGRKVEVQGSAPDFRTQQRRAQLDAKLSAEKLRRLERARREVRLDIAAQEGLITSLEQDLGFDISTELSVLLELEKQKRSLESLAQDFHRVREDTIRKGNALAASLSSHALGLHPGKHAEQRLRVRALAHARKQLYRKVDMLRGMPLLVASLHDDHASLLAEYNTEVALHSAAEEKISVSEDQLQEIQRIVSEVELQVDLMKTKLDEYDRQLCDAAEKQLILKGLKSGKDRKCGKPLFQWPVASKFITARFREEAYKDVFHTDHNGIDLRAAQGTKVRASADGIVHRVQRGGTYGYSYVLIAHSQGYATLYGHLSDIHVQPGQHVGQGQVIGLSGGTPGTVGAGPMTTGPHLHFEVFFDSQYVNPTSVLPG